MEQRLGQTLQYAAFHFGPNSLLPALHKAHGRSVLVHGNPKHFLTAVPNTQFVLVRGGGEVVCLLLPPLEP